MRIQKRSAAVILASIALGAAAVGTPSRRIVFEKVPQSLGAGRSPSFLVHAPQSFYLLSTRPAANGSGEDVVLQSTSDVGDSFGPPLRLNDVPGEVSDHGENSPILLSAPDDKAMYAVWNARDPKVSGASHIRFSRSVGWRATWSAARTIDTDGLSASHSFHGAAVAPDGAIYIAWLGSQASGDDASGVQVARSIDGGETFGKSVRVASDACPCCRVAIGFSANNPVLVWRAVETGNIRDMVASVSSDRGLTWSKPALVSRDGWKLNGCPHVGASVASVGSSLLVAWFTEGADDPGIFLAASTDGGKTFGPRRKVSGATVDPTHPKMKSDGTKAALVFQARNAQLNQSWGRVGIYYREIYADGSISDLVAVNEAKLNASFPSVALGLSGRIFIGWTQTEQEKPVAYMARGRSLAVQTAAVKQQ
jgi:hypothetical protein